MWSNNVFKGLTLVLGFCASFAVAAQYTAKITYNGGELYYTVEGGTSDGKCTEYKNNISITATDITSRTITFFSDNKCSTKIVPISGKELFGNNTNVSATISADGKITVEKGPAAPATQSSSSVKSSSSSAAQGTGGGTWNPGGNRNPGGNNAAAGKTVIRFLTPWTNTSAVLFVNGDSTATMTKVKNYCGWFEAAINPPATGLNVHFKQTIGLNFVGSEGVVQKEPMSSTYISLDSIAALTDTIWVQGYKNDVPALFAKYPGVLGECPLKKFPVTVFDWLHGSGKDGDEKGQNGDPANGVSADFGSGGCTADPMRGMVKKDLGANGVPVPADPFPENCKRTTHLASWFLPEVITKKNGVEYTNMTCRDLYISMDDEGFWLAEVSYDKNTKKTTKSEGNEKFVGGMFLVDDFEYLDEAQTIKNPYFDNLNGSGGYHNFGFAVKIQATFEYVPGQYFDFYGDDDVWVFINKKLAVDIGGQHGQVAGAVDLDTLGLKVGETYDFHIFYVERHTSSSNFRMRTSIDLQVDASIFVTSNTPDKNSTETNYNVWQINKKNKLSCGYDPKNTEVDTTGGASTFRLTGGNLEEPEILGIGTHFEGLKITSDSTFSIDSAKIIEANALAPGHYYLEITLKSDPSQTTTIEIVIPSYPLPSIAFADEKWKVLGKELSGNQATVGKMAYEIYPVNITFFEEQATVNDYNRKITISTSTPLVDILDEDGNPISKVTLNDKAQATVYIRANAAVTATLIVKGTAANASTWKNLTFEEPPIPRVSLAKIGDRNGDGRGDSLYVEFDKSFDNSNILDSIQFTFGETFAVVSSKNIKKISDNTIVVTSDGACDSTSVCGFGSRQFTGGETDIYTGNITTWVTYKENGNTHNLKTTNDPVQDGIGPIIVKATKETMSDGNRKLTLTFSEAISDSSRKEFYTKMFQYICIRSGEEKSPEEPVQQGGSGKTATLVFSPSTLDAVFPTDGDQVRFTANKFATDLSGNNPHKFNPWVTIIGDQELTNESPKLISVDPENPIVKSNETTQPILITNTKKDAQQIGEEYGVQGNLVDFDISKTIAEQTTKEIAKLDTYIAKLTNSSKADSTHIVTEKTKEEVEQKLIADIITGDIGESYGITEEVINEIRAGNITADNYTSKIKDKDVLKAMDELVNAGIENSRQDSLVVTPPTITGYDDIFEQIANGTISEKDLKKAGVSDIVIQAIKDGVLTSTNIEEFRSGNQSLISENAVTLAYRTRYYDHLGGYVGGKAGTVKCTDAIYGTGGCIENKGKLFLAWNMRDNRQRLVATGIYIARLEIKVKINGKVTMEQTRDKLMGVRRGKN